MENRELDVGKVLADFEARNGRRKVLQKRSTYGMHHFRSGTDAGTVHLSDFEPVLSRALRKKAIEQKEEQAQRRANANSNKARLLRVAEDLNLVQGAAFEYSDVFSKQSNKEDISAVLARKLSLNDDNSQAGIFHQSNSNASIRRPLAGFGSSTVKFKVELGHDEE